jgi:hypothetical protein
MQNVLVRADFNAHFDIKDASPCFAVLKLEVTMAMQVLPF